MSVNEDRNARTMNVNMKANISNPRLTSLKSINNMNGKNLDDKSSSYQMTSQARVPGKFCEESKHASAPQLDEPDFDRDRITPALSDKRDKRRRSDGFTDGKTGLNPDQQVEKSPAKGQVMKTDRAGSKKK